MTNDTLLSLLDRTSAKAKMVPIINIFHAIADAASEIPYTRHGEQFPHVTVCRCRMKTIKAIMLFLVIAVDEAYANTVEMYC